MFVHGVYFWLKADLNSEQRQAFLEGVQSLATIETVQQAFVGEPAPTDRAVIERGYSTALVAIFADQQAHDACQTHAVHDRFREQCSAFWSKVLVYDTIC